MVYKGDRGTEWIDQTTKKLTEASDGADLLARWLVYGFSALVIALAGIGLWFAAVGGMFGHQVVFLAAVLAVALNFAFHRGSLFSRDQDEREALVAWKAMGTSALTVMALLILWSLANGFSMAGLSWVPSRSDEWKALAFAAAAILLGIHAMAITWLTPPYLAESDDEYL